MGDTALLRPMKNRPEQAVKVLLRMLEPAGPTG